MNAGELWAYSNQPYSHWYLPVRIQKIEGSWAVIRFIDQDGVEGKPFRKPTRNLRSLWDDIQDFRHTAALRHSEEFAEVDAAEFVFDLLVHPDVALVVRNRMCDVRIDDYGALSDRCGLTVTQLKETVTDGTRIARALVTKFAGEVALALRAKERMSLEERIRGLLNGPDALFFANDEHEKQREVERQREIDRPCEQILRTWLGQESVDLAAENERLRVRVERVERAAVAAILELRRIARTKRTLRVANAAEACVLDGDPQKPHNSPQSTVHPEIETWPKCPWIQASAE